MNGITIFKMEMERIITRMVIFTKESGKMENLIAMEITFIAKRKEFTKVIGKKEKNKDLDSFLLMIAVDILVIGKIIKRMDKAPMYIRIMKNMKVAGIRIKKKEKEITDTRMVIIMMVTGKMIVDKVKER